MAVKFRDYYKVLGVPRTATEEDIRKEYRKLARKHHPDVNRGDKSAEDKFKEVNEAYQVLSDPEKRKRYDQLGPDWQAGSDFTPPPGDFSDSFGNNGGRGGFSDFFESMFSGRAGRAGATYRSAGENIDAEIGLTLEEAHRGVTRKITLQGAEPKSLEVTIPPGVRNGSVVRLAGEGEPGINGGLPGDLRLHIRIEPHPRFRVLEQGDLELELPVAPWEVALGAKVAVPTLDGSVEMTIRAGTQSGQRLRLRGQGMNRRSGGRGDLYAKIRIVNPPRLSSKEKELFEKLAVESRFDARELLPEA
jgi:curved DNA-binding protein